MLLIYRVGTVVPLPGIDIAAFQSIFANAPGIFEQINLFAGGALERMSIFMLSIFPYISASIIMQLMRAVSQPWIKCRKRASLVVARFSGTPVT